MMVELTYSATEMAVEEPHQDALALGREVCLLFERYFDTLRRPVAGSVERRIART